MSTATPALRARRVLGLPITLAALLLVAPSAFAQSGGSGGGGGGVEAEGRVTARTDSSLTVGGRTFRVTAITRITDDDRPIPFSAVVVGLDAEVRGFAIPGGLPLALTIDVEDSGAPGGGTHPQGLHAEGLVSARTATQFTVGTLTFAVTDSTRVRGEDGPATYADVQVGTRVEVYGFMRSGGALVASLIEIDGDGPHGPGGGGHGEGGHGGIQAEGLIQFVSADSIRVRNRTFVITDSTRIFGRGHRPLPVDSLAVGQRAEVFGRLLAGGTLVARMIEVQNRGEGAPEAHVRVSGAIEALTAASLTVSGRVIAVTAQTTVYAADRSLITFAALTLGQSVEVSATVGTGGALTATRIKVQQHEAVEQEVRVRAALNATGDSLAFVLGRPFAVRRFTRIFGLNRAPATLASLPVGGLVEVRARRMADGGLVAFSIAAQSGDATTVSLTAIVTRVSRDSLSVIGVPFAAAGAVVTGRTGAPGTFADVALGQTVRITGTASPAGFRATRIAILRAAQALGRVSTAAAGRITLSGATLATTAETLYLFEDGTAATAADVRAGTDLLAYGTTTATGTLDASQVVVLTQSRTTAGEGTAASATLAIERVFPNPTTGSATVRFSVAAAATARLTLLDARGRTVLTAVDGAVSAGSHEAVIGTAALPTGLYIVRLSVDGQAAGTRTLTVIR